MSTSKLPSQTPDQGGAAFFPSFQQEINRLIDQFRNGFPMVDALSPPHFGTVDFPLIDVVENDDAIHINADVPGIDEDALDVTITGGALVLRGEKRSDHSEDTDEVRRIERHYGSFQRRIPLGFVPDHDAVQANYADGVLKLEIAKPAELKAQSHKVAIKKS